MWVLGLQKFAYFMWVAGVLMLEWQVLFLLKEGSLFLTSKKGPGEMVAQLVRASNVLFLQSTHVWFPAPCLAAHNSLSVQSTSLAHALTHPPTPFQSNKNKWEKDFKPDVIYAPRK